MIWFCLALLFAFSVRSFNERHRLNVSYGNRMLLALIVLEIGRALMAAVETGSLRK